MIDIQGIRKRAYDLTDKIIKKTGPRLAGTDASLEGAKMLAEEMKGITDKVDLEEFTVHKGAFLGWIKILVSCYFIGVIFLWLDLPLVSLLLIVISLLILVFQFFLYKHFTDFLYPKKQGLNVVGYIEPKGEVKNQVIISGHHDSARIFNFFIHQPKLYNLRVTGGIGLVILLLPVSILLLFIPSNTFTLVLKILVSLGFLLSGQMWFFASKKGTPGAGDNLIASSLAVEIGRHLKDSELQNTRIIMLSFDAEEEGLRGARAYAVKHHNEFKKTPTYLLNVDCPYNLDDLFFLTSDINCSVQLSSELAEELVSIAHANSYPAKHQPIAFLTGGTDAGELAKVGVKCTTLMAMPWNNNERASVYHTPNDTLDSVETKAIDAIIDIFTIFIKELDMQ